MPQVKANERAKSFRVRVLSYLFKMDKQAVREFQAGLTVEVNETQFKQLTKRKMIIQDLVPDNTSIVEPSLPSEPAKAESKADDSSAEKMPPPPKRGQGKPSKTSNTR